MQKLHEECGVFGIYDAEGLDVASACYYGLFALQHRGQESCGIVVNDDGVFTSHKDAGLVDDVFTTEVLQELGHGQMALGHVRYGTSGAKKRANAQPMVVNHVKGSMAIAHNGMLTNAMTLREELEMSGLIFHTTSDLEVIAYIITRERLACGSIEEAVVRAMKHFQGAYSLIVMSPGKLIAARDPLAFRPLCIGRINDSGYVIASESCALDSVSAKFIRDVEPGEVIVLDKDGLKSYRDNVTDAKKAMCAFEFIYFARPDSIVDGSSVHVARQRAGAFLALNHPIQADVVIGVPDSGLDAAIGYSKQSGIPYDIGFIKNKYIGRTFIEPGQSAREDRVRIKLNVIPPVVKGKRVVLVDDSIVRGTTISRIVKLLREAGATEVHMRSSAPPFIHPCHYGVAIDSKDKLIACKYSIPEIAEQLGVDSLGFLDIQSVQKLADGTHFDFCDACFTGNYPTELPDAGKKYKFDKKIKNGRSDG